MRTLQIKLAHLLVLIAFIAISKLAALRNAARMPAQLLHMLGALAP